MGGGVPAWRTSFRVPEARVKGAESKFVKLNCFDQVDFCPFRGPDAPLCAAEILPQQTRRLRVFALQLCHPEQSEGSWFLPVAARCGRRNQRPDRKSTRLNSSHLVISYAV